MLSWQVGRVKITRIVEMDLPVPATVIPQATPAELRKSDWLYPHFVSEDDATLNLSVHALLVDAPEFGDSVLLVLHVRSQQGAGPGTSSSNQQRYARTGTPLNRAARPPPAPST